MESPLSNEEKRSGVYKDHVPTSPSSVNMNTAPESLNLNWSEKELPERERTKHVHRLHPYLGKYIPQLVEIFLRKYFQPGQTVLDPFVGSGTTLVQANELGINAVGYDISAFNVLLCRAKTKAYDLSKVSFEILDILAKVEGATQDHPPQQLSLWSEPTIESNLSELDNDYLLSWFAPRALRELITYRDLISQYENQDILRTILSRSARSSRLTTHFDLDFPKKPQTEPYWCYKHSRTCYPTEDAFKFIKRYSKDTIRRLRMFQHLRTSASVEVFHEDSRFATIPAIDGLITSPPYVGLIDYHEQHRYAYELLGLEDRSENEIGAAKKGKSKRAHEDYLEQIADVIKNARENMAKGGIIIVVAGDKENLYPQIAEKAGIEPVTEIQRHVNRRTGRRSSEYYETVFVWRNPE